MPRSLHLFLCIWSVLQLGRGTCNLRSSNLDLILVEIETGTEQNAISHIFKESMPQLSSRTDVVKRNRVQYDTRHQVIFVIRQRNRPELIRILHDVSDPFSVNYGQHLTRDEIIKLTSNFESRDAVTAYIISNEGTVISETVGGEYVTAEAPISVWERIFDTEFFTFHQEEEIGIVRASVRAEKYSIPKELDIHVQSVLNTIEMPKFRHNNPSRTRTVRDNADRNLASYYGIITPQKLKQFYNMTKNIGSNKSTQAVFASNGQTYSPSDLRKFQTEQYLLVNKALNVSGHQSDSVCILYPDYCGESNLDIQYIMASSEGSPTTHWYSYDFFHDWLLEISNAVNPPLVLSISYGADEKYVTTSIHDEFTLNAIKCGTMGITIFVASGDDGVNSNTVRGKNTGLCGYEPDFPAGNPYVTSVGATSGVETGTAEIVCQGDNGHSITSGGGFSAFYPQPEWQAAAVSAYFTSAAAAGHTPVSGYVATGRGYPDIALAGSTYLVTIGGKDILESGTSASCPVAAGFFSNINAARLAIGKGSLGWINPALYAHASSFVNDITVGNTLCAADGTCCTQGFYATPGWDPTTGLGSLNYGQMATKLVGLGNEINGAGVAPTVAPSYNPFNAPTQHPTVYPTPSPTSKVSAVVNTALIVGVVVGILAFNLCIVALVFFYRGRCCSLKSVYTIHPEPNPVQSKVIVIPVAVQVHPVPPSPIMATSWSVRNSAIQ